MLVNAVVLYIRRKDGSIYEKHLFRDSDIHLWQMACMMKGIQILKMEQVVVFIPQE